MGNRKIKDRCASAFFLVGRPQLDVTSNTWRGPKLSNTSRCRDQVSHQERRRGICSGVTVGREGREEEKGEEKKCNFSGFKYLLPFQSASAGRQRLSAAAWRTRTGDKS